VRQGDLCVASGQWEKAKKYNDKKEKYEVLFRQKKESYG
jgi:hypothetical protein